MKNKFRFLLLLCIIIISLYSCSTDKFTAAVKDLQNEDPKKVIAAANALKTMKDPRAVDPLIQAIEKNKLRISAFAVGSALIKSLAELDDPRIEQVLLENLESGNVSSRRTAFVALCKKSNPVILKALMGYIRYYWLGAGEEREALKNIGVQVVPYLIENINYSKGAKSYLDLKKTPEKAGMEIILKNNDFMEMLEEIGAPAAPFLMETLNSNIAKLDFDILEKRGFSAIVLARIKDPSTLTALIEIIKKEQNDIFFPSDYGLYIIVHVMNAVNAIDNIESRDAMNKFLIDRNTHIRKIAQVFTSKGKKQ